MQAPILCEMVAFAAPYCKEGESVCKAYCNVAEQWAAKLECDLHHSQQTNESISHASSPEEKTQTQSELQIKITMCHYMVVITCGCSAAPGTVQLRDLKEVTGQLCRNFVLVCATSELCRSWLGQTYIKILFVRSCDPDSDPFRTVGSNGWMHAYMHAKPH